MKTSSYMAMKTSVQPPGPKQRKPLFSRAIRQQRKLLTPEQNDAEIERRNQETLRRVRKILASTENEYRSIPVNTA
jgi:hypothetical protein